MNEIGHALCQEAYNKRRDILRYEANVGFSAPQRMYEEYLEADFVAEMWREDNV